MILMDGSRCPKENTDHGISRAIHGLQQLRTFRPKLSALTSFARRTGSVGRCSMFYRKKEAVRD